MDVVVAHLDPVWLADMAVNVGCNPDTAVVDGIWRGIPLLSRYGCDIEEGTRTRLYRVPRSVGVACTVACHGSLTVR